jgi:hypothetical protein
MLRSLLMVLLLALPATAAERTVKVFLLAGQSNMEGHGFYKAEEKRNGGKGSLEDAVKNGPNKEAYKHLVDKAGQWVVRDDVFVHYAMKNRKGKLTVGYGVGPDTIGPELGFGHVVGDAFEEPVLLVKLCWGGKSLGKDFRPPSAGAEVGAYYKEVVDRSKAILKDLKSEFPEFGDAKPELVGFGWHQGWNDRVNQPFVDEYESNMVHFIRDIRKDLDAPKLPFVIAETGMGGVNEKHPRAIKLMKAQENAANRAEFQGNVAFVGTKAFWRESDAAPSKQSYHWNSSGATYFEIGDAMGKAMLKLCGKGK